MNFLISMTDYSTQRHLATISFRFRSRQQRLLKHECLVSIAKVYSLINSYRLVNLIFVDYNIYLSTTLTHSQSLQPSPLSGELGGLLQYLHAHFEKKC